MEEKNEICYGDGYLRDVRALPSHTQEKLASLLVLLISNPFHALLHTKPLGQPLEGVYAFRITRGWRVGFMFIAPHVVKLLAVDDRGQIYQRSRRLLNR